MAKVHRINKSKKNSNYRSRVAGIFILITIITLWLTPAAVKLIAAKKKNVSLNKELARVEERNSDLKKKIKKLHSKNYIEIEARKQLGYTKSGEKAYIVIEKKAPVKKKKAKVEKSWWDNSVDYIKGIF